MAKGGVVYMLTNANHTVIYVGVTSDIISRMHKHIHKFYPRSFSARYNIFKLVYMENFTSILEAMDPEKRLKGASRRKKEELITSMNPTWKDLYPEIFK